MVCRKKAVSNLITMVNKQHIWAQPSTHYARHTDMLGANVIRCNQYTRCPERDTRLSIIYLIWYNIIHAIVTNFSVVFGGLFKLLPIC